MYVMRIIAAAQLGGSLLAFSTAPRRIRWKRSPRPLHLCEVQLLGVMGNVVITYD